MDLENPSKEMKGESEFTALGSGDSSSANNNTEGNLKDKILKIADNEQKSISIADNSNSSKKDDKVNPSFDDKSKISQLNNELNHSTTSVDRVVVDVTKTEKGGTYVECTIYAESGSRRILRQEEPPLEFTRMDSQSNPSFAASPKLTTPQAPTRNFFPNKQTAQAEIAVAKMEPYPNLVDLSERPLSNPSPSRTTLVLTDALSLGLNELEHTDPDIQSKALVMKESLASRLHRVRTAEFPELSPLDITSRDILMLHETSRAASRDPSLIIEGKQGETSFAGANSSQRSLAQNCSGISSDAAHEGEYVVKSLNHASAASLRRDQRIYDEAVRNSQQQFRIQQAMINSDQSQENLHDTAVLLANKNNFVNMLNQTAVSFTGQLPSSILPSGRDVAVVYSDSAVACKEDENYSPYGRHEPSHSTTFKVGGSSNLNHMASSKSPCLQHARPLHALVQSHKASPSRGSMTEDVSPVCFVAGRREDTPKRSILGASRDTGDATGGTTSVLSSPVRSALTGRFSSAILEDKTVNHVTCSSASPLHSARKKPALDKEPVTASPAGRQAPSITQRIAFATATSQHDLLDASGIFGQVSQRAGPLPTGGSFEDVHSLAASRKVDATDSPLIRALHGGEVPRALSPRQKRQVEEANARKEALAFAKQQRTLEGLGNEQAPILYSANPAASKASADRFNQSFRTYNEHRAVGGTYGLQHMLSDPFLTNEANAAVNQFLNGSIDGDVGNIEEFHRYTQQPNVLIGTGSSMHINNSNFVVASNDHPNSGATPAIKINGEKNKSVVINSHPKENIKINGEIDAAYSPAASPFSGFDQNSPLNSAANRLHHQLQISQIENRENTQQVTATTLGSTSDALIGLLHGAHNNQEFHQIPVPLSTGANKNNFQEGKRRFASSNDDTPLSQSPSRSKDDISNENSFLPSEQNSPVVVVKEVNSETNLSQEEINSLRETAAALKQIAKKSGSDVFISVNHHRLLENDNSTDHNSRAMSHSFGNDHRQNEQQHLQQDLLTLTDSSPSDSRICRAAAAINAGVGLKEFLEKDNRKPSQQQQQTVSSQGSEGGGVNNVRFGPSHVAYFHKSPNNPQLHSVQSGISSEISPSNSTLLTYSPSTQQTLTLPNHPNLNTNHIQPQLSNRVESHAFTSSPPRDGDGKVTIGKHGKASSSHSTLDHLNRAVYNKSNINNLKQNIVSQTKVDYNSPMSSDDNTTSSSLIKKTFADVLGLKNVHQTTPISPSVQDQFAQLLQSSTQQSTPHQLSQHPTKNGRNYNGESILTPLGYANRPTSPRHVGASPTSNQAKYQRPVGLSVEGPRSMRAVSPTAPSETNGSRIANAWNALKSTASSPPLSSTYPPLALNSAGITSINPLFNQTANVRGSTVRSSAHQRGINPSPRAQSSGGKTEDAPPRGISRGRSVAPPPPIITASINGMHGANMSIPLGYKGGSRGEVVVSPFSPKSPGINGNGINGVNSTIASARADQQILSFYSPLGSNLFLTMNNPVSGVNSVGSGWVNSAPDWVHQQTNKSLMFGVNRPAEEYRGIMHPHASMNPNSNTFNGISLANSSIKFDSDQARRMELESPVLMAASLVGGVGGGLTLSEGKKRQSEMNSTIASSTNGGVYSPDPDTLVVMHPPASR